MKLWKEEMIFREIKVGLFEPCEKGSLSDQEGIEVEVF